MKAAYGKKHQDRKRRMEMTSALMSVYMGISVIALHELWWFGQGRFETYVNTLNEMLSDGLERYKERGDTERVEAVGNLYYASRRNLTDAGVEIDKIDKEFAPSIPVGWKETYVSKGNPYDRRAYLESIDLSIAPIWYLSALYLRDAYGFGAIRLTRYYTRCRELFVEFWKEYMKCTEQGDEFCSGYVERLSKKCLAMGVKI